MGSIPPSSGLMKTTFLEDLAVGQSAIFIKTVSEADIQKYAEISGDVNPIHLDAAYAATTMFKERIAHGMLSAGFISAVFGTVMPGPGAVYVSQNLQFKRPVKINDTVTARVEVVSINTDKKFVSFKTQCLVNDKVVIDGEATLMVPSRG